uniref:Uncharacterized protein n=1 Tax=Amphora coffeiformis TaxID=265554 RepID=A0A7S3L6L8_9STRA|mmetsp:Transcript_17292/g.32795  ORF Transcript_17292/g.32795 Transcript_17292/m.32795 type:complete len:220 (-) Transcript_17292:217-876(-)|eukprot:scaffold2179_cov165-Amphora_coffeaeformis.AAC.18
MADVNTVRQLNNAGATSLTDGDIDTAQSLLHLALGDLRLDLAQFPGIAFEVNGARPNLDPFMVPIHQNLCGGDLGVSPNNSFHVFTKAFVLPETETDFDGIAVILMYNFGVVLQRRGVMTGQRQELTKAKKIYGMATTLLKLMEDRGRTVCQALAVALWNNLGYLHSHFLEFAKVHESKEKIREYLARGNELSREDLLFFHQTVLFLDNCDIASLAAAA